MKSERSDVTIDPTNTKRIIKQYYEQSYSHKSEKLDEMVLLLENHNLQKFI